QKWMRRQSQGLQKWGTFVPVFANMATHLFGHRSSYFSLRHDLLWGALGSRHGYGRCNKDTKILVKTKLLLADPPVLWIPKDELGVAEDEIIHTREAYGSMGISCDGASLDAQGKLILEGQPPDWRLK
ncbi:hypothetical protein O988_05262, partial [Pseudogymnoascus sp. VKM F-3808]